jgi:hypothetical protein
MARVAGWLGALAICVALTGCADDAASGPVPVAKDFVESMAAADPAACELMTPGGANFLAEVARSTTCEAAIESGVYARGYFNGSRPEDLTREIDAGELTERGLNTYFEFCLPNDTKVKLDLEEFEGEWLVDLVGISRAVEIDLRDRRTVTPCRLR